MHTAKSIDITFENCETITLEPKDIGFFSIENIAEYISRDSINSISKYKKSNLVIIEIFASKINSEYFPFDIPSEKMLIKERFLYNDITSLEIYYSDGSSEEIFVEYNGNETNDFQKTVIGNNGNLYIVISKDSNITDYFTTEMLNDEELALLIQSTTS